MDTKVIAISLENVAHMLAGEWDDVVISAISTSEEDRSLLIAVADAIKENGGDIPTGLVELLPVTVRAWDGGSSEERDCDHGDDFGEIAEDMWDGADYGDGDYCVTVSWEATDYTGKQIDSGSFDLQGETPEPECQVADEHDWTSDGEGGCTENPGVWSTGGTSMSFRTHCRACGLKRLQCTTGSQRNPGDCDTTTYEEPDSWCADCQSEDCGCQIEETD